MEIIFVAALIALAISNLCIWFTLWLLFKWGLDALNILYTIVRAERKEERGRK